MQSADPVVSVAYESAAQVISGEGVISTPLIDIKTLPLIQVPAKQAPPPPYHLHIQDQAARKKLQESQNAELSATESEDKNNIYRHQLFPLLALLFERCEQATQTKDCPSSDTVHADIASFQSPTTTKERKPVFLDTTANEADDLMIKALQVLRIHLLELEKVNELCTDFCTRYISCLKSKLHNEQLLNIDSMDGETSPVATQATSGGSLESALASAGVVAGGGTVFQMIQTPQGLVAQPVQIQQPLTTPSAAQILVQGSTPLSQIGNTTTPTQPQKVLPSAVTVVSVPEEENNAKSQRRGVLPKQATHIMKSWLFQHIVHPYPSEDEKRQLNQQTGLSILQINNWFINARRRILQPMLDSQPSPLPSDKQKKARPAQSRPQNFWPASLANYIAQKEQDCDDVGEGQEDSPQHLPPAHTVAQTEFEVQRILAGTNTTSASSDHIAKIQQVIIKQQNQHPPEISNVGTTIVKVPPLQMVTLANNSDVYNMISNVQNAASALHGVTQTVMTSPRDDVIISSAGGGVDDVAAGGVTSEEQPVFKYVVMDRNTGEVVETGSLDDDGDSEQPVTDS